VGVQRKIKEFFAFLELALELEELHLKEDAIDDHTLLVGVEEEGVDFLSNCLKFLHVVGEGEFELGFLEMDGFIDEIIVVEVLVMGLATVEQSYYLFNDGDEDFEVLVVEVTLFPLGDGQDAQVFSEAHLIFYNNFGVFSNGILLESFFKFWEGFRNVFYFSGKC
jgi:hypothetical protein